MLIILKFSGLHMVEFALDWDLKEMCLDDEKPQMLKNLPKFSSAECNVCSIIGHMLNPDMYKISNMIHDMPRVWRVYNRARGVAVSHDRFQFIFDFETDLSMTLDFGAWTYENWSMVLERWVEQPPEDYLSIWIWLRNIHVNHYTTEMIEKIGINRKAEGLFVCMFCLMSKTR